MADGREHHQVRIGEAVRHLPLFEVAPGVRIAIFNMLGDTEIVEVCAELLLAKLQAVDFKVLVTPEAKSIPLAHAMARRANKDYVVLRKVRKGYMGDTLASETVSITTGEPQTLYLDEKDLASIEATPVVLVDDVISTGSTLRSMRQLMDQAGAKVVAEAAVFTEGDADEWQQVVALGHLPVFT